MLEIAVFGSGRGSNCAAILDAIRRGMIPDTRVCLAVSNNSGAGILEIARSNDIPALHLSRSQFQSDDDFVTKILHELRSRGVNFIALAGYMKKLPPRLIAAYRNRIVNIHPALLPKFGGAGMYGMHVHRAVLAGGERVSGASVHIVDEEYDRGPVVMQEQVLISPEESPESLAAKVLAVEHRLYPEVLRKFATGEITVDNGEVFIQS